MGSASQEIAVARVTGPAGGTATIAPGIGAGRWLGNNNIAVWVILAIIFFVFWGGGFGFGNKSGCDSGRKHHHHHHHHDHHDKGNNFFFFGENGWFILIIIAALFFLNDGFGGANTNIINVDTDDAEV
jgi:hypothetical protein